ncbi:hypothetical protein THIX_60981 [Thiomonas sp. X19]|uniref:magnesium transporter n=1 Tax=Thiomonas sp. X19 TaxID=1050370 RepID=UPI000B724932|nr:magnesium transporter [Thiomonas sp. X19]SCC94923.1 hypothetical protein THIX_60981 [Thiomonas sp. X19]
MEHQKLEESRRNAELQKRLNRGGQNFLVLLFLLMIAGMFLLAIFNEFAAVGVWAGLRMVFGVAIFLVSIWGVFIVSGFIMGILHHIFHRLGHDPEEEARAQPAGTQHQRGAQIEDLRE